MSADSSSSSSGSSARQAGHMPSRSIGDAEKANVHDAYPDKNGDSSLEMKDSEGSSQQLPSPATSKDANKPALHPAFYIVAWISMSSAVILFNKYLLDAKQKLF
ncbi:hypothetical protein KEM55_002695, partial [Ascosphaera atra]